MYAGTEKTTENLSQYSRSAETDGCRFQFGTFQKRCRNAKRSAAAVVLHATINIFFVYGLTRSGVQDLDAVINHRTLGTS
jgi:hypothetical protein